MPESGARTARFMSPYSRLASSSAISTWRVVGPFCDWIVTLPREKVGAALDADAAGLGCAAGDPGREADNDAPGCANGLGSGEALAGAENAAADEAPAEAGRNEGTDVGCGVATRDGAAVPASPAQPATNAVTATASRPTGSRCQDHTSLPDFTREL